MGRRWASFFYIILLGYLVAGGLYAGLTPAWQAPDEPAHYNYIRFIAGQGRLPELVPGCYDQAYLSELTARRFPAELPVDSLCYEFHQPPLYYLLASPLFLISSGNLLALRLFSLALGAGVVVLAWRIGQTIFPQHPIVAYGTMAFVAFVPMHLAILASVNNDALAELMFAALLWLAVGRVISAASGSAEPSPGADGRFGLLLGLGLLSKMTVYIAVPLVALSLAFAGRPFTWSRFLKPAGRIYGLAGLIALPWYLRNLSLYGGFDLLGLVRHDQVVVGQLRTTTYLAQVGWPTYLANFFSTTFHSFWGQFGWMAVPMDQRTYRLLTLLTLLAIGGLVSCWGQSSRPGAGSLAIGQRRSLWLLASAIGLMVLAYGWYNLSFIQFQGRYLFPALIPLGLFFSLGLTEALAARQGWALLAGLTLGWLWLGLGPGPGDDLDKWAILWGGLATGLATARLVLAPYWPLATAWLVGLCYSGLFILTLLAPFWFVLPYLVA